MVSDLRVRLSRWENTLKLNQALTKSMNMDICVICTLNQLKKVSYNQINFQKKQVRSSRQVHFINWSNVS